MVRLVVILLGLFTLPALAQDAGRTPVIAPDCYCTDKTGGRVELGEVICLFVDGRAFQARCEMSLNNPMWRPTGEGCESSRLRPLLHPATNAGLVHAHI